MPTNSDSTTTSADHGQAYVVRVDYPDGGKTLHGPFQDEDSANAWLARRFEEDPESTSGGVLALNLVEDTYHVTWSAEDQEFVATCSEFPSLSWLASTPSEALAGLLRLKIAEKEK